MHTIEEDWVNFDVNNKGFTKYILRRTALCLAQFLALSFAVAKAPDNREGLPYRGLKIDDLRGEAHGAAVNGKRGRGLDYDGEAKIRLSLRRDQALVA